MILGASRTPHTAMMLVVAFFSVATMTNTATAQNPSDENAPTTTATTPITPPEVPRTDPIPPAVVKAVLGSEVRSVAGESMGRVVDVIVDQAGQVRSAVIDFGGFLGVGSRQIAVEWSLLRFSVGNIEPISVELTKAQVREAPEYKPGKPIVILGARARPAPEAEKRD
jgi:hypothetical protein